MQEQHFNHLVSLKSLQEKGFDIDLLREKVENNTPNLPEGKRTPTAQEMKEMRAYADQYKKASPRASNREVRRAVQRKFGVTILQNTY